VSIEDERAARLAEIMKTWPADKRAEAEARNREFDNEPFMREQWAQTAAARERLKPLGEVAPALSLEKLWHMLHYLFTGQAELPRAVFKQLTGLGDRVATSLLSALLAGGYLASDTPYGPVRFAVPRQALRFYFPALWPEAEQDEALLASERRQTPARAP